MSVSRQAGINARNVNISKSLKHSAELRICPSCKRKGGVCGEVELYCRWVESGKCDWEGRNLLIEAYDKIEAMKRGNHD